MKITFHPIAKGYTLIEMILVIVLTALILSTFFLLYRDRVAAQRVRVAVQQIQILTQASLAFFNEQNKWPTQLTDLTENNADNASTEYPTVDPVYLPEFTNVDGQPETNFNNPWGQPYSVDTTFATATYMALKTQVPAQEGQSLVESLPMAQYVSETNNYGYLDIYIPRPSLSNALGAGAIRYMGYGEINKTNPTVSVKIPLCLGKMRPQILFGIAGIQGASSLSMAGDSLLCRKASGRYNISSQADFLYAMSTSFQNQQTYNQGYDTTISAGQFTAATGELFNGSSVIAGKSSQNGDSRNLNAATDFSGYGFTLPVTHGMWGTAASYQFPDTDSPTNPQNAATTGYIGSDNPADKVVPRLKGGITIYAPHEEAGVPIGGKSIEDAFESNDNLNTVLTQKVFVITRCVPPPALENCIGR